MARRSGGAVHCTDGKPRRGDLFTIARGRSARVVAQHRHRLGRRRGAPVGTLRPLSSGDRAAAGRRAGVRVLLHPAGDPRSCPGTARRRTRGCLPGNMPAAHARRTRGVSRGRPPPALRLRADGGEEAFDDTFAGRTVGRVDDVVLQRNDGVPAYNLAVVVDDAEQGVTEVVRGDDLLASTPAPDQVATAARPADAALRPRAAGAGAGWRTSGQAARCRDPRRPRGAGASHRATSAPGWQRASASTPAVGQ